MLVKKVDDFFHTEPSRVLSGPNPILNSFNAECEKCTSASYVYKFNIFLIKIKKGWMLSFYTSEGKMVCALSINVSTFTNYFTVLLIWKWECF